ncbi:MAG: hypothetical protein JWO06_615 [Bacteroidota bacterium]|nr:hypothetical protein [Bacteroidota bacterium]
MIKFRNLFLLVFSLLSLSAAAQLNFEFTEGKFLIKGKVVDLESRKPLAFANVIITNLRKGVTCDNEGNFSLYVYMKDTLKISYLGYLNKVIHVSDIDSSKYYTLEIPLYRDAIKIKEINIYPYNDLDAFKKAFVDAKEVNKVHIPGIAEPKYSNKPVAPKFSNPISFLYDKVKRRSSANPDFKP